MIVWHNMHSFCCTTLRIVDSTTKHYFQNVANFTKEPHCNCFPQAHSTACYRSRLHQTSCASSCSQDRYLAHNLSPVFVCSCPLLCLRLAQESQLPAATNIAGESNSNNLPFQQLYQLCGMPVAITYHIK
jgi:hypothetical protein